jgi:P-type E1-E2 ATPase
MDIKSDEILERLCEINCIVTDKTGTFTRNRMTVSKLWFNEKIFQTQSKGVKEKYIDYEFSVEENGFQELMKAAVLLSKAHFIRS